MNPESLPEIFVLLRHFYGVASTAAVMMACMEDAATVAEALGLHNDYVSLCDVTKHQMTSQALLK